MDAFFSFRTPRIDAFYTTSTLHLHNILHRRNNYMTLSMFNPDTRDEVLIKCDFSPMTMVVVVVGKKKRRSTTWPRHVHRDYRWITIVLILLLLLLCKIRVSTVFSSSAVCSCYMQFVTSNVVAWGGMGSVTSTLVHFSRSEYFLSGNNIKKFYELFISLVLNIT